MRNFEERRFTILLIFITVLVIFSIRLFYMQIINDYWKDRAAQISEYKVYTYPPRGIIYDRNGKKMVENKTFYDLMVIPKYLKEIDTTAFCKLVGITKEQFIKKINEAKKYSRYVPSPFEKQISSDNFERISEELYKYPGFYAQERMLRGYSQEIGAHVLGYISEVDSTDIKANPYYRSGDFIGKKGLEQAYEYELRGVRGVKYILKDAIGNETGSFENGKYDTAAMQGHNLYCTIDANLQAYGEMLMQNKKGSIVCIEPSSGEILALISAPTYNPSLMTGREKGKNYLTLLRNDSLKPLYNRAIQAMYPPGSIFKMVQSLIALEEGVITTHTGFSCDKSLVGCHAHPTANDLKKAIQFSCNPYFYQTTRRIIQQGKSKNAFIDSELGLAKWTKYMHSFGLGIDLGIDMPSVKKGFIPDTAFYNQPWPKGHGKHRWAFSTIYSISIGQGEVLVTPLQMANIAAIIANRGYYYIPHFIKGIGEKGNIPEYFLKKNHTLVSKTHFEFVADAMRAVVEEPGGTGGRAKIPGITVCGKTGTAENPHGEDHAVFIAFAPMENPKIAISVYVENAGFGGVWAAPIASLMMEKYIKGSVSDTLKEKQIKDAVILDTKKYKATLSSKKKKRNR
jgi:penicillin-binding protein 2